MTTTEDGKPIQSTGTRFAYVGVVVIDDATKSVEDNFLLDTSNLSKDEEVDAVAQEIMAGIDEVYGAPFATSEVVLDGDKPNVRTHETNLGDLVTDAMVWSVVKEGGIEQVELRMGASHQIGVSSLEQVVPDGGAHQSTVACHIYLCALVKHRFLGLLDSSS